MADIRTVNDFRAEKRRSEAKAAYFEELMRKAAAAQAARKEAEAKAKAPVTITLGNSSVTLDDKSARELAIYLKSVVKYAEANPDGLIRLPDGGVATGKQVQEALGILILTDKV